MTNKNIDKLPQVYTISYYDKETNQNLIVDQLRIVIDPIGFRVVNKDEPYHSRKAEVDDLGYGPMISSFAESERFTNLKIPCLYSEKCGDTTAIDWIHALCGGSFKISNEACVRCKGCGITGHVKDFSFKCSKHSGDYRSVIRESNFSAFQRALSISFVTREMEESVTLELIRYLRSNRW